MCVLWGGCTVILYQLYTNCYQIFINSLVSSSWRLANQSWLKHMWATASYSPMFSTCFSLVTEKAYLLYRTTENKMATRISTGYELRTAKLFFDGDDSKYKLWEVKFLGYLRIQHLHQIILSLTDRSDDMNFIEKNTTVFAEIIQYVDDKSH